MHRVGKGQSIYRTIQKTMNYIPTYLYNYNERKTFNKTFVTNDKPIVVVKHI